MARDDQRRGPRPPQGGGRGRGQQAGRSRSRDQRSARGQEQRTGRGPRSGGQRSDAGRSEEQQRYDGPPLPEEVTGRELDRSVRQQLRSLPDKLALRVARHLVAAGQLLDVDPETAYQHTLAARSRAARLAIVREACGEAAYLAGHYAESLTELRAAKRMNGSNAYLPLIADCERALGRPERALALATDDVLASMDREARIEMMIVASGARLDLGQPEVAAAMLEGKDLRRTEIAAWSARLRYAYADALLAGDRFQEATEWFHRAAAVDSTSVTDAADRALELEGLSITDTEVGDTEDPDTDDPADPRRADEG